MCLIPTLSKIIAVLLFASNALGARQPYLKTGSFQTNNRQDLVKIATDKSLDPNKRAQAIAALYGHHQDPEIRELIMKLALDDPFVIKLISLRVLGRLPNDPKIISFLKSRTDNEKQELLKQEAIRGLTAWSADPEIARFLVKGLKQTKSSLLAKAFIRSLHNAVRNHQDEAISILQTLARQGNPKDIRPIAQLTLALNCPDHAVWIYPDRNCSCNYRDPLKPPIVCQ